MQKYTKTWAKRIEGMFAVQDVVILKILFFKVGYVSAVRLHLSFLSDTSLATAWS